MAIFNPNGNTTPEEPAPQVVEEPVSKEAFVAEVVDSEFVPASALLTHVSGYSWTVKYFQQYLSEESVGVSQEDSAEPIHQQYIEINDLVIKVESPLSQTQNSESGEFEVTGEAILVPTLKANKGDMFIADIGDGRTGVFSIETVTRLSILKDACFKISYVLKDHLTAELLTDFKQKTIKSVYFQEDFLHQGSDPILVEEEKVRVEEIKELIPELTMIHYTEFFSNEEKTLILNRAGRKMYDPALVKAWNKMIPNEDLQGKDRPLEIACTSQGATVASTIWDSLLQLDDSLLYMASNRSRVLSSSDFVSTPFFGSIALTGIETVMWGMLEPTHKETLRGKTVDQLILESPTDEGVIYETPETIYVYPIELDSFYIFSKPFYANDREQMSGLELQLSRCFKKEALDSKYILELCETLTDWTPAQRFYLIPFLIILLKVSLREI